MKAEQFDNLTRAFATGISRRHALKLIIGALILGSCGKFGTPTPTSLPSSGPTPTPPPPPPGTCTDPKMDSPVKNINTSVSNNQIPAQTCEEANQWARKHKPSDSTGKQPNDEDVYGGLTEAYFSSSARYHPASYTSGGMECLKTTRLAVQFSLTTTSYSLNWKPPAEYGASCIDAVNKWKDKIAEHEGVHVADAQKILNAGNRKWKTPKTYRACADTTEQAKMLIDKMIKADLDAETKSMRDLWKRCGYYYHNSPTGKIPDITCSCCIPPTLSNQQYINGLSLSQQDQVCCPPDQTPCGSLCCDPKKCERCVNGSCQSMCGSCQSCVNSSCQSMCGSCQTCDNDQCRNCNSSEVCCNGECCPGPCCQSGENLICCPSGTSCCPGSSGNVECCGSGSPDCCTTGEGIAMCCPAGCQYPYGCARPHAT